MRAVQHEITAIGHIPHNGIHSELTYLRDKLHGVMYHLNRLELEIQKYESMTRAARDRIANPD